MTDQTSKTTLRPQFAADFALRASAITMGFVFLMGGWRRFFNMPAKHDITSPAHLANKLVEAAPGSPIESIIHWMLYHPFLTEWSVYLMSSAEVIVGLCLIFGILTRLTALGSGLINVALMLIFGWMGFECLDEWTMAALGFAISVSVMLYGPGAISVDRRLNLDLFARCFSKQVALGLTVVSVLMTVGFYSYFFGIFDFHKRTSTGKFSIVAEEVIGNDQAATLYVNAGPSGGAAYLKSITFTLADGTKVVEQAQEVNILRDHFAPWSHSGKVVDGVLKMRLGAKLDIALPENAVSAVIDLIDHKDPQLTF